MTTFTVTRAREILLAIPDTGIDPDVIAKMPARRLQAKLEKMNDLVTDATVIADKEIDADIDIVLAGLEAEGSGIKVIADAKAAPEEEPEAEAAPAKKPRASKKKPPAEKPAAKPRASKKKDAAPAKPAAKKAAKEADPNKPAGVRKSNTTAPYYAGQVIREFGIEVGVTDEMVTRVGELAGRDNPNQDEFNLRNSWHAIRAYNEIED